MRTRVASIITAPLRLVRWLLRSPGKLARLRGKARIAAFAGIALLVVVAVLVLRPRGDSEKEVRETLDRFAQATRDKDYQELCDEILARDLVDRVRRAGLPCEVALKFGFEKRQNPRLEVLGVQVNGDRASARVRTSAVAEVPSTDVVELVDEDGWRVASLSSGLAGSTDP